jgi:hypothetical protein
MKYKDILLTLVAIVLPIALADLMLKAMQLPKSSSRTMLLAGGSLYTGKDGHRRYDSNRSLEQSAVYGSTIAYRYRYRTNNLGLVSSPDIKVGEPINLAITGDSFAEGQGGFAWIPLLQQRWLKTSGKLSLNYAIAGSGFSDFALAASAAKKEHKARRIMILFIENDAYRPYIPMASNSSCSYYSNGILDTLLGPFTCRFYDIVWHHVPRGLSDQQLIKASNAYQNYGVLPSLVLLFQQIVRQAINVVATPAKATEAPKQGAPLRYGALPKAGLDALAAIKQLYGAQNVLMVMLPDQPQSSESTSGGLAPNSFVKQLERATGLSIVELGRSCPLNKHQFHQLDSHPNSRGYQRLAFCLANEPRVKQFVAGS